MILFSKLIVFHSYCKTFWARFKYDNTVLLCCKQTSSYLEGGKVFSQINSYNYALTSFVILNCLLYSVCIVVIM
jgi:hypothetical protein